MKWYLFMQLFVVNVLKLQTCPFAVSSFRSNDVNCKDRDRLLHVFYEGLRVSQSLQSLFARGKREKTCRRLSVVSKRTRLTTRRSSIKTKTKFLHSSDFQRKKNNVNWEAFISTFKKLKLNAKKRRASEKLQSRAASGTNT